LAPPPKCFTNSTKGPRFAERGRMSARTRAAVDRVNRTVVPGWLQLRDFLAQNLEGLAAKWLTVGTWSAGGVPPSAVAPPMIATAPPANAARSARKALELDPLALVMLSPGVVSP